MATIDLPAWGVDDDAHSITGSNNLSTTDTGTELVLDQSSQPLRVGIYSVDGSGSGNIVLPSGVAVSGATYVVIAYAEGSETLVDPEDWSPDTPNPTQAPFLMIETSADSINRTLDPIPVGGYAGETLWPADDLASVNAGTPANRLWLQSYGDVPIHVAYLAVRLTVEDTTAAISGTLSPGRTHFS